MKVGVSSRRKEGETNYEILINFRKSPISLACVEGGESAESVSGKMDGCQSDDIGRTAPINDRRWEPRGSSLPTGIRASRLAVP